MIRAIPIGDGTFYLQDGYNQSEKTYHIREAIKQVGGKWKPDSKHWIIPESAIEQLGVERMWLAKLDDGSECWVDENEIKRGEKYYRSDGYYVKILEVLND